MKAKYYVLEDRILECKVNSSTGLSQDAYSITPAGMSTLFKGDFIRPNVCDSLEDAVSRQAEYIGERIVYLNKEIERFHERLDKLFSIQPGKLVTFFDVEEQELLIKLNKLRKNREVYINE